MLLSWIGTAPVSNAQVPSTQRACETPLIAAIEHKETDKAIELINDATDLNARACGDLEGTTALIEAIRLDETRVIERLLSKGADANEKAGRDESPLFTAAFYCRREAALLLLKHGAEINSVDSDGFSPLMQSTQNCSDGWLTVLLLRSGAKVNIQAKHGETALTTAAFHGNEDAVHVLIAAGADPGERTADGATALTLSRDRKVGRKESHDRIYKFLLQISNLKEAGATKAAN